jgi:hypothetical protein
MIPGPVLEDQLMQPIVLFGIQFTLSLAIYALMAAWHAAPRLAALPRDVALSALLWVHALRVVGGTILAPGAVDPAVPMDFRTMVGLGDLATAVLAIIALVALRLHVPGRIAVVWLCVVVGLVDTANAVAQSIRYDVFSLPLGMNWVIVAIYVPSLLVSSVLMIRRLAAAEREGALG